MKKCFINNKRKIIVVISLIILSLTVNMVFFNTHNAIDKISFQRTSFLTNLFLFITKFGNAYTLILITLLTLFIKNKKSFKYISVNLVLSSTINFVLKLILQRPRPIDIDLIDALGYSYPSGHAMVSLSFYGFIIYLLIKSNIKMYIKISLSFILILLIILIGISRVYLGVHYLTDIIAGYSVSIIYLAIYTMVYKHLSNKK